MPIRLDARSPQFEAAFVRLLGQKREASSDVEAAVRDIIADVRARGDAALFELSRQFDGIDLEASGVHVSTQEIADAVARCRPEDIEALAFARERIEVFHRRQIPRDDIYTDALGATLGWRWRAVESVGLYVPGGSASYPSSVLMNAIPARVAGVPRIVMAVPAKAGRVDPLVFAAARIAGVDEVVRIGGAQAIAALAYGTDAIRPVVKIVGPGNAYVAAAKRQVFGQVGIDMIAGPSEVVVVADRTADPAWIAADLLAQAEHDPAAQSILITDDATFAGAVEAAVEVQLPGLSRREVAEASWRDFGAVILVGRLADAVALIDRLAPEHLELVGSEAEALSEGIRNAGAIFLGAHTPEAIGDYVGGSNHVLPTARSARYASGLGVLDFMKRTSLLRCRPDTLEALGPAAITLGQAEGLTAHARSVAFRLAPAAAAS